MHCWLSFGYPSLDLLRGIFTLECHRTEETSEFILFLIDILMGFDFYTFYLFLHKTVDLSVFAFQVLAQSELLLILNNDLYSLEPILLRSDEGGLDLGSAVVLSSFHLP